MSSLGKHIIVDCYGCSPELLNDVAKLEDIVLAAVAESGATYLEHHIRPFYPQGVTGVVIIAESHFAFHTWPEHGYIALDYFTCGDSVSPNVAVEFVLDILQPRDVDWLSKNRGERVFEPEVS